MRMQVSATSLVDMTTPLCDASMQKEKEKKGKRKEKRFQCIFLVVSHVVVHWDDIG